MKRLRFSRFGLLCVATLLAVSAQPQNKIPISTDGSDPAKWDKNLDSPKAAPGNHKVIFEDSEIRIQSVTVPPGTQEPYHLHPYYSILVFDSLPSKIVDRDAKGNTISTEVFVSATKTAPMVVLQPPNALHSVKNNDTISVHLIRIEGKNRMPQLLSYPKMGPISEQGALPISTDGSDPKTWDPNKASAIAAPKNHKILFENENLRVISVTIPAGTTEPLHDHPFDSLLLIDSNAKVIDHDAKSTQPATRTTNRTITIPFAFLQPPQALHAVQDLDPKQDAHLIRIEFKKGLKQL